MSKSIAIIGRNGKMAQMLVQCLREQSRTYKIYSKDSSATEISDFGECSGVIDFSLPEATAPLLKLAVKAKVPFVCGTTGWKSSDERLKVFKEASSQIPIVWDSNFSLGVEILSQVIEILAQQNLAGIEILDIHHSQKRDAPSGTSLKLKERALSINSKQSIQIDSVRFGEVAGEHKILLSFKDELLEFTHRALSRKPFAEGALKALLWAQNQKPGFYSMKDVLK